MLDNLLGQTIGRYELTDRLGPGRVGAVFKAYDPTLEREVVVKVLDLSAITRPATADRLLERARAAALLDHPGLVKVHDFGRRDNLFYVVMDFLAGANLRDLLQNLRANNQWLPLAEAVGLIRQLALVLDYLSQQGVPARSLRPSDIMLKPDPTNGLPFRPVLTSLGLTGEGDDEWLPESERLESPAYAYASPEQVLGERLDARSQVYSLGVLLYELAVGWQPFPVKTAAEAVRAHSQAAPPPPRARRADLPASLEGVILRALAKDPDARYPDPAALAQALTEVAPQAQQADEAAGGAWAVSLLVAYQRSLATGRAAPKTEPRPTDQTTASRAGSLRYDGNVVDPKLVQTSPNGWLGVYVETPQMTAPPGQQTAAGLVIVNWGPASETYSLQLAGLPHGWVAAPAPPASLHLAPGALQRVRLTLAPPRTSQARAGRYTLTVRVASQRASDQAVEAKLGLTVPAYGQFHSELTTPTLRPNDPARVIIHNQGNTSEVFTIGFDDPADVLRFDPPAISLSVPEGHTGAADFFVTIQRPRLVGGPAAHGFTVRVAGAGGQTVAHPAEVHSMALVPVWLILLLAFVGCMLLGVFAFAYWDFNSRADATATAIAQLTLDAVGAADSDGDGLSNADEVRLGTDPFNPDTDGDGLSDGDELIWRTDPLNPDTDGDNLLDGLEVHEFHTDPTNRDTDGDGFLDDLDPDPGQLPTPTASQTGTPEPTRTETLVPPTGTVPTPTETLVPPTETPTTPPPPSTLTPTSTETSPPPTLTPGPTATPQGGIVLFESGRAGLPNIYRMYADGSSQTLLSATAPVVTENTNPAWSATAGRIVFQSTRDGNLEIYSMLLDDGSPLRLTNTGAPDRDPSWSPNGGRIVFVSERDGNPEIYVMNADGSGQTRLTDNAAADRDPAWSPNGTQIVFVSERDGNPEIYVMNSDGGSPTRLTDDAAPDGSPAWAPNGTIIAFVRGADAAAEIYRMAPDGGSQTPLTSNAAADTAPVWAPNSTLLAYVTERDGNPEIYLSTADGTVQTRLTNSPARDAQPVWSPDGARLAFVSERDGNPEVYVMLMAGTSQTRLTSDGAADAPVAWVQ